MSATAHKSLAEALLGFQAEAPTLPKDGLNPHFKSRFTPLDTIVETIGPLLCKHGLVWATLPGRDSTGEPALTYRLMHAASGEVLDGTMPLMLTKADPQGQGSAITYARRYSITAVLNLVADEDDDGNSASRRNDSKRQANGNGGPVATDADQAALVAAAKGLKGAQIRMALAAIGVEAPADLKQAFAVVPASKTAALAQALAGIERES